MNITKIIDFLSSKNIEYYYNIYKETQWYNEEQMRNYQLTKFKKLIEHCYTNVPFYRNYMKDNKIFPNDIVSMEQATLFPVVTKELIKDRYKDFTPLNLKLIKGVKSDTTGGTTGNILVKRNDAITRSSIWATFKRFYDWMDIAERDKKLFLMGGHVIRKNRLDMLKNKITNILTNSISFSPYDTSEENYRNIINVLEKNDVALLRGYSQFLFSFCQRLENEGLKFNIKAVTTTAEPIMPVHRELFKKILNAETYDQYGCGEIGGIAYECEQHSGLHVSEERVYLEVNESNQLIITDLDNFSMPFIRYFNADEAIVSHKKCRCGRESQVLEKILGRTCDYVKGINGEVLHWAYFWHLVFDSSISKNNNLRKVQVIQTQKDKLKIRLVSNPLTNAEEEIWIKNIQSRMGKINIEFSYEDDIENSASGKYRPVICNI